MAGTFSATVSDWVRMSQRRMEAVFRESAKLTVSLAQDRIPIDTGFARASVRASLQEMPLFDSSARPVRGQTYRYNEGPIVLVINGATLGQTVFVGYTANYAGVLESGSSKQAPSGFVRLAALQWQQTVSEVTADAKARVG